MKMLKKPFIHFLFVRKSIILLAMVGLLVPCSPLLAQKRNVDSLLNLLKTDKEDTNKIKHYNSLSLDYRSTGEITKAMCYSDSSIDLAKKLNDQDKLATDYNARGGIYYFVGDYPNALQYLIKALKIYEDVHDKLGVATIMGNMGLIYKQEQDSDKMMEYFFKALKAHEDMKDKSGIASVSGNISNAYMLFGDTSKAMFYSKKALSLNEELGDKYGIALDLGNIGSIYDDEHNYEKTMFYYEKALNMEEEMGNKSTIATTLGNMGYLYMSEKKYDEAESYMLKSLDLAKSIGDLERIKTNDMNLGILYSREEKWQKALEFTKEFTAVKDSIINQSKSKQIGKLEAKAEYQKDLALQKAEEDKNAALALAEKKREKTFILLLIGIAVAIAIVSIVIFRSLRITRKQKALIEEQTAEVAKQKIVVEGKNKEILDSISYAKRLQEAILPSMEEIERSFPDSFILYKPKDIVAGDFYWFAPLNLPSRGDFGQGDKVTPSPLGEGRGGAVFIAAADCTGHGVPGAMVSVVCSNALNRAVKEFGIIEPGKILDKTRELVLETFEKTTEDVKDGMDISLCAVSPLSAGEGPGVRLQWSGANNPLWYMQNGEMKEIPADKQPIGKYFNVKPFTTHKLTLKKGDSIYLFSDGYADQFGGPNGKKFKYKQLLEKLKAICHQPIAEQKSILVQTFEEWKGELEQVDDVLIIGIRV